MTILLWQKPLTQVVRQIVQRDNGALFDPSDLSTLYQDAAGTTPVTAVEQPVGLMLDKSRGMILGPELVSNGDFSDGLTGWSITGNDATHTVTPVTGGVRFLSDTTNPILFLRQTNPLLASAYVEITIDIDYTSGQLKFDALSTSVLILQGRNKYRVFLNNLGVFAVYRSFANVNALIRSVSVKIISGYHATQSITASRPTLSARYNLLTKTEDFESAAWSKNNSGTGVIPIVTNNYGVAPDGSNTATRVQLNKGGGTTSSDYSSIFQTAAVISGTNYSGGFWLKTNDETIKTLQLRDDAATIVNKLINASPEWVFIPYAGSATASSSNTMRIWLRGARGTSDSADILVWHPQLSIVTTPGPYQRVNTATDYDTDERYFPKYLQFSSLVAIDDYMNLPYMSLYNGGSASIVCAMDAVSQATDTYIISERSTTDADPKYFPSRQLASDGNMDTYITDDAGAVVLDTVGSPFSGVANAVIRSIVDSGNNLKLFKNGQLAANNNYTRSGTLTLNTTTIGASVSTTTSNYASMKLYGLIVTKSAITDSQRIACERYLGRKSGVQL